MMTAALVYFFGNQEKPTRMLLPPLPYRSLAELKKGTAWVCADLKRTAGIETGIVEIFHCGTLYRKENWQADDEGRIWIGGTPFYPYLSEKAIRGQRSIEKRKSGKKTKKQKERNVGAHVGLQAELELTLMSEC